MIFKIVRENEIETVKDTFHVSEQELEKFISMNPGEVLPEEIFHEELLFLGRQIRFGNKRFDMLALDRMGNCVILELKKEGVFKSTAMQALDYASLLGNLKGEKFFHMLVDTHPELKEPVECHVNDIADLNKKTRIILMGQLFEPSAFSLGRWIADKDIAFKCIQYHPVLINGEYFINFSTVFSQWKTDEYAERVVESFSQRKPKVFWHFLNAGEPHRQWWEHCRIEGKIGLNFENLESESCPGFRKMNDYMKGDEVFIWAKGIGCVGHGVVSGDYEFKSHGILSLEGHSHTRSVHWRETVSFDEAIESSELKALGLGNPRQAKQEIIQNRDALEKVRERFRMNNKKVA